MLDGNRGGELWDAVRSAGEEFRIRPIAPCEARRIEAGIFNYGSDINIIDTPFHVMGMERLVEAQSQEYMGKTALELARAAGVDRKLVGIELEGDQLRAELSEVWPAYSDGRRVGRVQMPSGRPDWRRTSGTCECRSISPSPAIGCRSSPRKASI